MSRLASPMVCSLPSDRCCRVREWSGNETWRPSIIIGKQPNLRRAADPPQCLGEWCVLDNHILFTEMFIG